MMTNLMEEDSSESHLAEKWNPPIPVNTMFEFVYKQLNPCLLAMVSWMVQPDYVRTGIAPLAGSHLANAMLARQPRLIGQDDAIQALKILFWNSPNQLPDRPDGILRRLVVVIEFSNCSFVRVHVLSHITVREGEV